VRIELVDVEVGRLGERTGLGDAVVLPGDGVLHGEAGADHRADRGDGPDDQDGSPASTLLGASGPARGDLGLSRGNGVVRGGR
jgi:hypothetical protein